MDARTFLEAPFRTTAAGKRVVALGRARQLSEQRKSYLFDARTGIVTSHGARIAWYEYGPDDAEFSVVFIHGYTLAAEAFHLQVEYLRQRWPKLRLLLVDLRGHGLSERVAVAEYTVDTAADDVLAVLSQRVPTGKFLLLGHSLGGPVALSLVRRAPREIYERLAGVVQVSTTVEAMSTAGLARLVDTALAERLMARWADDPERARAVRHRLRGLLAPVLALAFFMRETDDELIDLHAALIHETPTDTLVGFFDDLQVHEEVAAAERLAGLPGFVLVGERDHVTPVSQAERLIELWPEAKLQLAHGAGHMLPLEAPGIVNAALDRLLYQLGWRPGQSSSAGAASSDSR